MIDRVLTDTTELYATTFFATVIVVLLVEWAVPRRRPGDTLTLRWFSNGMIYVLDSIAARAILPVGTIAWATICAERGWGLLNTVNWPASVGFLLTIVFFDFVNYGQHYLLHRVPVLWRVHRTHHSDAEYDFTTGLRFHPLESFFFTSLQLAAVTVLGPSPAAVFTTQIVFLLTTFFDHANVRIPRAADRVLRMLFVTPDMHRIHHSQAPGEGRSNLSNMFSWWDRLFGTYVEEPASGHEGIVFGLREFGGRKHTTLPWMLAQPFLSDTDRRRPQMQPPPSLEPTSSRR